MTYDERLAHCTRLRDLYEAERLGLVQAKIGMDEGRIYDPLFRFFADPEKQKRFELGYREGLTVLACGPLEA